jgi:hypothetical protein
MTFAAGIVHGPETVQAIEDRSALLDGALEPYDAGRSYLNFVEQPADSSAFYGGETFRRLQSVRAKYDAGRLFRANHEIAPAE